MSCAHGDSTVLFILMFSRQRSSDDDTDAREVGLKPTRGRSKRQLLQDSPIPLGLLPPPQQQAHLSGRRASATRALMGTMPTVRRDSSECDDDSVVTALGGGNVSRRGSTAAVKGKGLSTTGPPLARRPLRLGLALSKSGTSDSETTVTVGGGGFDVASELW